MRAISDIGQKKAMQRIRKSFQTHQDFQRYLRDLGKNKTGSTDSRYKVFLEMMEGQKSLKSVSEHPQSENLEDSILQKSLSVLDLTPQTLQYINDAQAKLIGELLQTHQKNRVFKKLVGQAQSNEEIPPITQMNPKYFIL